MERLRTADPDRAVFDEKTIHTTFGGLDEIYCFDKGGLLEIANTYDGNFAQEVPWPHLHLSNFVDWRLANDIYRDLPTPKEYDFYKYDNLLEKKFAFDRMKRMPEWLIRLFLDFHSPAFLVFLERLSGINGLIPDPYLRGCGVHMYPRGGNLAVHLNNNMHPKLSLYRRLDVILYMNKDWDKSWGGDLQLWEGKKTKDGHVLTKMRDRYFPDFNSLIVMESSDRTYHGVPETIKCPSYEYRKSLAVSYYTAKAPAWFTEERKSPLFVKRPSDGDSLDELIEKRNKGRLATNITHELTSD